MVGNYLKPALTAAAFKVLGVQNRRLCRLLFPNCYPHRLYCRKGAISPSETRVLPEPCFELLLQRICPLKRRPSCQPEPLSTPALHRLEHQAVVRSPSGGESENNRRAKFYSLTKAGRGHLRMDEKSWNRLSAAVHRVSKAV